MCLRDSPNPFSPGIVWPHTLVATTCSSRMPNSLPSSRPVSTSLSPPL
jgi:hypothetical protein